MAVRLSKKQIPTELSIFSCLQIRLEAKAQCKYRYKTFERVKQFENLGKIPFMKKLRRELSQGILYL